MIFVYAKQLSPRLKYILSFILSEQLGSEYETITDKNDFNTREGFKINYSDEPLSSQVNIIPATLIHESDVRPQQLEIFHFENFPAFYRTEGNFPFDIFSAVFYLITRYEEYLPYEKDMYGRYAHTGSAAFKNDFLHLPLINIWISFFSEFLKKSFPDLRPKEQTFSFIPTYDIDIAYSYRYKGVLRNTGGFLKDPDSERIQVLLNKKPDPYDCYLFLHELHQKFNLNPFYFFLVAEKTGVYDKNISPSSPAMKQLIKEHKIYSLGIHPSWQSFELPELIKKEKEILENITGAIVTRSRQHYIKMDLSITYQKLIEAGIKDDYSMGYGSINGFRASTASSFNWYDLKENAETELRIHPFCFMDANSYYEQKQNTDETLEELIRYYEVSQKYCDQMITIFHNNILGTEERFTGWREMYVRFTSRFLR